MSDDIALQRASRACIRVERNGDPHWVACEDGHFALHVQYGGGAVIVSVGSGSEDIAAFREWLDFHWPNTTSPIQ